MTSFFCKFSLKLFVVLALYSHLTHAFCVYNKLEGDRVNLSVSNPYVGAPSVKLFRKEISQGGKECCPYDNKDCVPGHQRDSPITLYLIFAFDHISMRESGRRYTAHCEGGGYIVVTGSNYSNILSTCHTANDEVIQEKLVDWVPI